MLQQLGDKVRSWLIGIAECLPSDPKLQGGRRSPKWRAIRETFLVLNPHCAACGVQTRSVLEVHHILPFHRFPELELEKGNLITLCESSSHNCHFLFGHLLNWSSWNEKVREDAARYLTSVRNRPQGKREMILPYSVLQSEE